MAYFESVHSIINRKLTQKPLKNAHLIGIIQQVVGRVGQVVSVKNGIAKVRVSDQITGYQLMARQEALLDEIRQRQGDDFVRKIHVVVER